MLGVRDHKASEVSPKHKFRHCTRQIGGRLGLAGVGRCLTSPLPLERKKEPIVMYNV